MSGIDIFAWIIFTITIVSAAICFVALAQLPGKAARKRNHPQAAAINMAGWLGLLLTMGVVWVIAMIWSQTVPVSATGNTNADELERLRARVAELEDQLSASKEV